MYKMVKKYDPDMPIMARTEYRHFKGDNWLEYCRNDGTSVKATFSYFCGKHILVLDEKRDIFPAVMEKSVRHEISEAMLSELELVKSMTI